MTAALHGKSLLKKHSSESTTVLWKEVIPVYTENRMKPINTKWRVTDVKAGGTYSYHLTLKGQY
jgi:hypothetical protein